MTQCDIIIGALLSFSPIVIFVVGIYKSASPIVTPTPCLYTYLGDALWYKN